MAVPELHFFASNDVNGSTILEVPVTEDYFEALTARPALQELGGMQFTWSRQVGFAIFDSGAFQPENFVRLLVPEVSTTRYLWGGFLTDQVQQVIARMRSGEDFVMTLMGPKFYLARACLFPTQYTGTGWNIDRPNGVFRWQETATAGRVLNRIIDEAHANTIVDTIPDLTTSFTDSDDSDGNPWANDIAGSEEFEVPIGQSHLETMWALEADSDLETTMFLGTVGTPRLRLDAWQSYGRDLSGAIGASTVHFMEKVNILSDLSVRNTARRKASHVIVHGIEGAYVVEERGTYDPGEYAKAVLLESELDTKNQAVLSRVGQHWLTHQENGENEILLEHRPGFDQSSGLYFPSMPEGNGHYWIGDTVSLTTEAGASGGTPIDYSAEDQRVMAITMTLNNVVKDGTPTEGALSWHTIAELNIERASDSIPSNNSMTGAVGRCCDPPFPEECAPTPGDTLITDTDGTGWLGTISTGDGFTGNYRFIGGSGGTSAPDDTDVVSPGNYSITVTLGGSEHKYTGRIWVEDAAAVLPQLVTTFPNAVRAPGGHGTVTSYSQAFEVPAGYDRIRYRHESKMGGWRYQAEIYALADAPTEDGFCIPEGTGGDPDDPEFHLVPHFNDPRFTATDQHPITRLSQPDAENNSGGDLTTGASVIPDLTLEGAVTTTNDPAQILLPVGILTEDIADGEQGSVTWAGFVSSVTLTGTAVPGDFLYTSSTPGELDAIGGDPADGAVGVVLSVDAGGLPTAVRWWGIPLAGLGTGAGSSSTGNEEGHSALFPDSTISLTKASGNPTFNFEAIPETVTKVGDTYYAAYMNAAQSQVNLATSTDRDGPWTQYAGNPVYQFSDVTWAPAGADAIYAPEIYEHDGTFYLSYSIYDKDDGSDGRIGIATSTDITGPYTDSGSARLSVGTAGAWDSLRVGEPSLLYHDGTWYMAYMGEDTDAGFGDSEKCGIATASDPLGSWTKAAGNPLIDWGTSGQWDDALTADPYLFFENGYFWCWYTGGEPTPWKAGLAYSLSPTTSWTKHANNPLLTPGASGQWDDEGSWRGSIYVEGGLLSGIYGGIPTAGSITGVKGGNFRLTVTASTTASDHVADTTDAHDASAISIADAGGYFTGTDVEEALQEVGAAAASVESRWVVDPGSPSYSGSGPVTVALTSVFGIDSGGNPYYNSANVTDGEEAALVWDNETESYYLRPYYP